jgi:hypothetical protein
LQGAIPTVDINGIGHNLKGIERNADGQLWRRGKGKMNDGQLLQGLSKKSVILKNDQEKQGKGQRKHHRLLGSLWFFFSVLFDKKGKKVGSCDRNYHQEQIHRLPPSVKDKAEHKQHRITPRSWNCIVAKQGEREKSKYKNQRGKNHSTIPFRRLFYQKNSFGQSKISYKLYFTINGRKMQQKKKKAFSLFLIFIFDFPPFLIF